MIIRKLKRLIRKLSPSWLALWIGRTASRSDFLARVYYVFAPAFSREQRAVLHGMTLHREQLRRSEDADGARHTLRRCIHRLEKGLISRPRRETFALNYLEETVDLFAALVAKPGPPDDGDCLLRAWSADVLSQYFNVTGDDPTISAQRARFEKIIADDAIELTECYPYARDLTPLEITYDQMYKLARRRRSCRWYKQTPVPREIIDKAIAVGSQSPSACNRQPFEFRVFDDPDLAKKIGAIPMGTTGFASNFPCVVVVVGKLRAFPKVRDRHLPYIDGALAVMAFQFALEVQGIGSCCINWPDIPKLERKMAKTLGLSTDERPVMLVSLGYPDPDGQVPYSQKKSLDEIRSYNKTC